MDALLRYILYHIAYTLLFLELSLMLFFCIAIVVIKFITRLKEKRRKNIQNELSNIIESALFSTDPLEITIPEHLNQFSNLIEVLEKFDHRFTDDRWIEIKHQIITKYLLGSLESYAGSFSWVNRQLAARCCLLYPSKAKKEILTKLLKDPKYLVSITAAVCITKTHYQDLLYEVIRKMSKEPLLSQFSYRDALIQMDQEKHRWLELLLEKEADPKIIAICLDVLSTRYSGNLLSIVKPFVVSQDRQCRIVAIKALSNISSGESIKLLVERLGDSDWEIRAEAIAGLRKLYATQTIPRLKQMLNDPIWWVRLQASLALKDFGKEGMDVLTSKSLINEPLAYEIAQYTLAKFSP